MRLTYLLRSKLDLFRDHDRRLREGPRPLEARRRFEQRMKEARRVLAVRTGCLIGIYLSAVLAAVIVVVNLLPNLGAVAHALRWVGGIGSSLTVLFVLGAFITTRALGYMEVDLYFYSQESRMTADE